MAENLYIIKSQAKMTELYLVEMQIDGLFFFI